MKGFLTKHLEKLVHAFVFSRLHYYNGEFAGRTAAARVLTKRKGGTPCHLVHLCLNQVTGCLCVKESTSEAQLLSIKHRRVWGQNTFQISLYKLNIQTAQVLRKRLSPGSKSHKQLLVTILLTCGTNLNA